MSAQPRLSPAATLLLFAALASAPACVDRHDGPAPPHGIPPEVEAAAGGELSLHAFALNGDFPGSNWVKSPNYYAANRGKGSITTIVIHTIQGSYKGCISWFSQSKSKVSAHYVIGKHGEITQMVKDKNIAWHVGSQNGYTLGIEHEGYISDPHWVTDKMLDKSAQLTCYWCKKYGLPIDRNHIKGHVDLPKQTHTDPGKYWPWNKYIALVKKHCGQGGGPTCPSSCDDGNACTTDSCSGGKCAHHDADGKVCWDGDPCTAGERCHGGKCLGGKVIVHCDDGKPCTTDKCSSKTGKCVHSGSSEGCSDGNPCTLGDHCTSSGCKWTTWKSCADGDACTADKCEPKTGKCLHPNKPGAGCDDANLCTDDACDKATGKCVHQANTADCTDGDACTQGDRCQGGTCRPGAAMSCDDGDACTVGDRCVGGACSKGALKTCGGADPCTAGTCNSVTGACSGALSLDGKPCDDGSPCTAGDACKAGVCTGEPVPCDDGNPCTDDLCGPAGCASKPNGLFCNDGNPCTVGDRCLAGFCPGKPVDCGDGGGCTARYCKGGVCVGGGADCDDHNACTEDSCSGGACQHAIDNGACDDGEPCTHDDRCLQGACGGVLIACADGDPCTLDRCDRGACVHSLTAACGGGEVDAGSTGGDASEASDGSSGRRDLRGGRDAGGGGLVVAPSSASAGGCSAGRSGGGGGRGTPFGLGLLPMLAVGLLRRRWRRARAAS